MGDASDNIPGLEGFGPKTAASLLQQFGTLDFILAHPEKVKGEKKQEVLRTKQKDALLSRELATLDTQVPIPKDETFYQIQDKDLPGLTTFFQEMKFNSLLKELTALPSPSPLVEIQSKAVLHPKYHLVDTESDLKELIDKLSKEKNVGIDTETTDVSPLLAHLVGIGFATRSGEAWYVPLNGEIGKKRAIEYLKPLFETSIFFFGHNLKYDYHILKNVGITIRRIGFDTLLASYLIDPQKRKHNLDDLCLDKFAHVKIALESLIGKGKKEISMRDVPIEKVKEYCCEDIDYTTRLKQLFEIELKQKKLEPILYNIELPLLPILAEMERVGIYLDVEQLRKVGEGLVKQIHSLKEKIFELAGEEFNLNSPKQMSAILYEKMGLKSNTTSTSAEVLEELKEEHEIAKEILEYRTLEKLRSTYVEALPLSVNPITGRIHCTFNQSITATGRLSSQDPNLQNIPLDSAIRGCFKPKEGFSFLGADYSQIELRLLAHFSKDPGLLKAFQEGRDIHIHTASLIYDVKEQEVTQEMRRAAKTVNFGIVYGQTAFGLSKQLGISPKEASLFIHTYFKRYPNVQKYLDECKEKVRITGHSTTLIGRQRPIPEIHNKNPSIRNGAERLAINTPLQGTAADLIKLAMIEIDREIAPLKGEMILQIHDELIFEIPDEEIPMFEKIVKDKMENVLKLDVPIEVHMSIGKTWAEC